MCKTFLQFYDYFMTEASRGRVNILMGQINQLSHFFFVLHEPSFSVCRCSAAEEM